MSLTRSDQQVALNDLHVALLESADHYRDAAEFLSDQKTVAVLQQLAGERTRLAARVEQAIRDSGDLPSVPDTDKETGEQLLHRLEAMFAADETEGVIEQRLDAEDALELVCKSEDMQALDADYAELKQACLQSINSARDLLAL